jgi:hypothetical protein
MKVALIKLTRRARVVCSADFGGLSVKCKQFAALPYRIRDDDVESC